MHRFIAVVVLVLIGALFFPVSAENGYSGRTVLDFGPSYISDTIPDRLEAGHSYPVMVTFRNNGLIVWETRTNRVGMVYAGDMSSVVAIPGFVEIPGNSLVFPKKEVTFTLSLLPVGLPGEYRLPFYVSFRNAQGDQPVTEIFEKKIIIVPADGVSSPQNGSIVVESPLSGLDITLNGVSMGTSPCIIPDLVPGDYQVEAEGPSFRRSFPVHVERGTLSRVFVDNSSAEPVIELKKIGFVSDGTLLGYINANIPLIVVVGLFILGCFVVMIHAVKLRKETEAKVTKKGKKKARMKKKTGEDPGKDEKDLLDEYHSKTRMFDTASSAGDPGSGSSSEGTVQEAPPGPMKNVRKFTREMLEVNQEKTGKKTGGPGGSVPSETPASSGGVELSLKHMEVTSGSARAHISAMNQTGEPLSVEGVQVGPGISVDIPVDVPEPDSDEYEMTISLKIFNSLGHSFNKHLLIPYNRGISLLTRGFLEKAYEYYQGVVQKNPRHVDALVRKAKILVEWGLDEEAEEILSQVYALSPDHEDALDVSRHIENKRKKKEQEKTKALEKPKIHGFPDTLESRYTPIRLLGKDSFASIILAIRNDTGDIRALKIAHKEIDVESSVYTEISVLYQLRHVNVLKMFRAEFNPNLFLELEYVSGVRCGTKICHTLADLPHPVPVDFIYSLIEGIALGVAYLHSKGVRHYHLSPKYILLDEPMTPKISGLIRGSFVKSGSGKEDPMIVKAPEQLQPEKYGKPGKKTDLFQMGAIWYWLITGTLPYQGGSVSEGGSNSALSGVYIPPGISYPEYSRYDPMIRKLLAPDKQDRYGSAAEFLSELWGVHERYVSDSSLSEDSEKR